MDGLPEKPEKPLDSDCCGNGCVPCVLDIYAEELAIWERACAATKSGKTDYTATKEDTLDTGTTPALSKEEYHQYQITSVTRETHDTFRFLCRLGHHQTLGLLPGQHIIIRGSFKGRSITRQYTPVSDVTMKGGFLLMIKVYSDGRMSSVVRQWQTGDWLDIRGPYGSPQYMPNQYSQVLMLAAGTGVAPMAQLIQAMLANESEEGRIRLLYACKTYADILMKEELGEWRRFWNFSALFVLSQEMQATSTSTFQFGEEVMFGKLDHAAVTRELGDIFSNTRVLICGTRSFDKDMRTILQDCQFPESQILQF